MISSAIIPYASRGAVLVQASATAIVDIASELGASVASGAYVKASGVATYVVLDVYASTAASDLEDVRRSTLTGSGGLARVTGNMASGKGFTIMATIASAAAQVRYEAEVSIAGGSRVTCQVSGKFTPALNPRQSLLITIETGTCHVEGTSQCMRCAFRAPGNFRGGSANTGAYGQQCDGTVRPLSRAVGSKLITV